MIASAGMNCEINIDDCKSKPCDYGKCIDKINGYECVCEPGYTGESEQHLCVCVCVCVWEQVNRWPAKCRACVSDNRCDLGQRLSFPTGTHSHTGVLYINATARMITRLTLCMLYLRNRYNGPCYTVNIGQQQEDFHNWAQPAWLFLYL